MPNRSNKGSLNEQPLTVSSSLSFDYYCSCQMLPANSLPAGKVLIPR